MVFLIPYFIQACIIQLSGGQQDTDINKLLPKDKYRDEVIRYETKNIIKDFFYLA